MWELVGHSGGKWEKRTFVLVQNTPSVEETGFSMFFGEFEHSLDSKGRLTIPAKFKDELASGIVLTHGLDGCLWAFTKDEWAKVAQKIAALPNSNESARKFKRYMFSGASEAIPDRNGRVIIPQKLREHAEISNEVVVAGAMDKLEIWAPHRWAVEQNSVTEDPEALIAQLDDLGI